MAPPVSTCPWCSARGPTAPLPAPLRRSLAAPRLQKRRRNVDDFELLPATNPPDCRLDRSAGRVSDDRAHLSFRGFLRGEIDRRGAWGKCTMHDAWRGSLRGPLYVRWRPALLFGNDHFAESHILNLDRLIHICSISGANRHDRHQSHISSLTRTADRGINIAPPPRGANVLNNSKTEIRYRREAYVHYPTSFWRHHSTF